MGGPEHRPENMAPTKCRRQAPELRARKIKLRGREKKSRQNPPTVACASCITAATQPTQNSLKIAKLTAPLTRGWQASCPGGAAPPAMFFANCRNFFCRVITVAPLFLASFLRDFLDFLAQIGCLPGPARAGSCLGPGQIQVT